MTNEVSFSFSLTVYKTRAYHSTSDNIKGMFNAPLHPVLRIRIRDSVPFSPLNPGSGMGKKSGSGMNITGHGLETIFRVNLKILKFFYADPDPGSGVFLTLDPGWKKFGSGINIPDPQQCLLYILRNASAICRASIAQWTPMHLTQLNKRGKKRKFWPTAVQAFA
jgi:hypothetical protein